eukprot:6208430-Pleurochrysis_carterae.AAC.2
MLDNLHADCLVPLNPCQSIHHRSGACLRALRSVAALAAVFSAVPCLPILAAAFLLGLLSARGRPLVERAHVREVRVALRSRLAHERECGLDREVVVVYEVGDCEGARA